ncbi:hypothetical protein DFJ73DRAFT_527550 [Zopfochytrium polystomum]|nr:hypothetical protein DFJ73DRAFT_527550 [Zopfochytrium polystomum]
MYNGIGLQTARGSGTNGYVQANKAALRTNIQRIEYKNQQTAKDAGMGYVHKVANPDIILHERKKAVEIKCLKLRDELENEGLPESVIDDRVQELREALTSKLESGGAADLSDLAGTRLNDTHVMAEAKRIENERVAAAFRISTKDYVEGASFNQELQEQKRRDRLMERERLEEERRKRMEEELAAKKKVVQRRKKRERKREGRTKKLQSEPLPHLRLPKRTVALKNAHPTTPLLWTTSGRKRGQRASWKCNPPRFQMAEAQWRESLRQRLGGPRKAFRKFRDLL